jgi:hypothetical protein
MSFTRIIWFARLEAIVFLGGLAAIIAYRMLTGGINTKYLLYGTQKDGTKYLSAERVQLLLFTLWTAIAYLLQVADLIKQAAKTGEAVGLPHISTQTLALLGGSHAIYLVGKAYTMLFKKTAKENNNANSNAGG